MISVSFETVDCTVNFFFTTKFHRQLKILYCSTETNGQKKKENGLWISFRNKIYHDISRRQILDSTTYSGNYYNNALDCVNYIIAFARSPNTLYLLTRKQRVIYSVSEFNLLLSKHIHEFPFGHFPTQRKKKPARRASCERECNLCFLLRELRCTTSSIRLKLKAALNFLQRHIYLTHLTSNNKSNKSHFVKKNNNKRNNNSNVQTTIK